MKKSHYKFDIELDADFRNKMSSISVKNKKEDDKNSQRIKKPKKDKTEKAMK